MPLNLTLLIQRTDIANKSGGDLIQFLQVKRFLEKRDYNVKLVPWNPQIDLQECDLVNLVNDRPLILADSLRVINKMKRRPRIIISPIHHSDYEVIKLRKDGFSQSSIDVLFSKLLSVKVLERMTFHWINILADFRMISISNGLWAALRTLSRNFSKVYSKRKLGRVLVANNTLQFLANGEAQSFLKDYQISHEKLHSKYIIPNGKPDLKFLHVSKPERIEHSIIVVGRIEPRKRSLELAKLAHRYEIPITFFGAFAHEASRYAKEFQSIVAVSDYVTYLGERSYEESTDIIGRSKVLLNVSFAEVLSLVELEAAAQGKWIVSSGVGYSHEYISAAQFKTFPENNLKKGLEIASHLAHLAPIRFNVNKILSWADVAGKYDAMYRQLISEKLKK